MIDKFDLEKLVENQDIVSYKENYKSDTNRNNDDINTHEVVLTFKSGTTLAIWVSSRNNELRFITTD